MACAVEPIDSGQNCDTIEGGIVFSYVTKYSNITAVTFDVNGQITAFTMSGVGLWEKWTYDNDNTSIFEEPGSLNGDQITFAQRAFMKFKGYTNVYRKAAQAAKECCDLVAVHFTGAGVPVVQGLEQYALAASGFSKTRIAPTRVVPTRTTDTGANTPRLEMTLQGTSQSLANITTLTEAAIAAL